MRVNSYVRKLHLLFKFFCVELVLAAKIFNYVSEIYQIMSDREQALISECLLGNLNEVKELLLKGIDPNCVSASLVNSKFSEVL